MPSNETLADKLVDLVRDGGLPNQKLVDIICNNVPYEVLVTLTPDVASAVAELDEAIANFAQARAAARPNLTKYEFGRAAS